jgi:hypothetical protein
MKLKKILLVAGAVGLGVVMWKSSNGIVKSLRHEAQAAVTWVETKVPMEKRFDQLRRDAQSIDGEMEKVKNDLAREIVEVRDLTNRTAELRAAVEKNAVTLTARGQVITDATEKVKYGARTFSKADALTELQKDVNGYARSKQRLALLETTLTHREVIKETLAKTLDSMKTKKAEVLAAIDEVEADYKQMQLTAVESKYQMDDTKLAQIKESLRALKKSVEIEKEKQNLTPRVLEETPASAPAKTVKEILAPVTGTAQPATIDDEN